MTHARGRKNGMYHHGERIAGSRNGMRTHPERRPCGERNGQAKLYAAIVRRLRRTPADIDVRRTAKACRVHRRTIERAIRGDTWRHL